MRDGFGREIDYMRISVIDSCNLNCYYCNPCDNNEHCHALNILSVKEVLCIVRAATRLGIKHFRLTGGEPLLHPQLDEMFLQIKKIPGVSSGFFVMRSYSDASIVSRLTFMLSMPASFNHFA